MKARITLVMGSLLLMTLSASALRNPALIQQGELPRDQYLNLTHPEQVQLDKICVKFSEDTRVRLRDGRFVSLESLDLGEVDKFLDRHSGVQVERLFQSMSETDLDKYIADAERLSGYDNADLNNWYLFYVPQPNHQAKALLEELLEIQLVQTCYYEPVVSPAVCGSDPAPTTPLWEDYQDYSEAAPTGIDIDYAWAHSSMGNGSSGYWWVDIEGGWCEDHEDLGAFSVLNLPDSTDPDWYNHGTAVVSIVSACDDGKGITGLTPDCTARARNVFNHPSTADAILAVTTTLIEGETYVIELHAPGPSQGTTCLCNCSQFEYIAMEYWTANFDAILANATGPDQLICVEAAGNGSMDLDWAGYGGAFDLSYRDSQAILVGAGEPGASHDPSCFTNHGSRISAYGWGGGVYAAGYGSLFNQTDCQQDYTYGFSGTSSATPIVTGAAISLANIHYEQEGVHAAPTLIRSRIGINGTPQASEFTHEIAKLPNMRGILAPDLAPYTPGSWGSPAVANNTYDDHTVPAFLNPSPDSTYFSWSLVNWSHYSDAVDSPLSSFYIDDVLRWTAGSSLASYTSTYVRGVNRFINGGRHVVRQELDADASLVEGNEINNGYTASYCWGGVNLPSNSPASFAQAPYRYPAGYSYPSCDGFDNNGNLSGYWEVAAVMPASSADCDLRVYNTAPTATSGYDYSYQASSSSTTSTDFVVMNQNQTAVTSAWWVGVHNYSNSAEDYTVEAQGSAYLGSVPATQTLLESGDLGTGEIFNVWEFTATAGQQVWFRLAGDGDAPARLAVYSPSTTYDNYGGYNWQITSDAATPEAVGTFTVTESGYHGLVLIKRDRGNLAADVDYSLYWGLAANPDLAVGPHAGYDAALVAKNLGDPCGVLPVQLNEGVAGLDVGINNLGSGYAAPGWNTRYLLEGQTIYDGGDRSTWMAPGGTGAWCGASLGVVKGGRHEVGAIHDVYGELVESNNSNNHGYTQYTWAPYPLVSQTPVTRSPAPSWRNFDNPDYFLLPDYNQDGYSTPLHYWTAVAAVPLGSSDQVNLQGFDYHSTGITDGLLGDVSFSYTNEGLVCVNVMNGNSIGAVTRDFGAHQNMGWPSHVPTDNYVIEACQSQGDLTVNNNYGPYSVASGHLLEIYDFYVSAAGDVPMTLFNDGEADLALIVYPPGSSYCDYLDALVLADTGGPGVDESVTVNFTNTGWAGIVVAKHGFEDVSLDGDYRLRLGTPPMPVPAPITDLQITAVDFSAGNSICEINFTPVTTDVLGNPLAVDHYRLYATQLSGYDFSSPYVEDLGTFFNDGNGLLYFHNIGWLTNGFIYLTAVDNDGVVLAASPGLPAGWKELTPVLSGTPIGVEKNKAVQEDPVIR
jgi:serine protease